MRDKYIIYYIGLHYYTCKSSKGTVMTLEIFESSTLSDTIAILQKNKYVILRVELDGITIEKED